MISHEDNALPRSPRDAPISTTTSDDIMIRGRHLAEDLIGQSTFTEMMLLDLNGEEPSAGHVRVIDSVLVALMEHGYTPSSLAARLVLDGAPESMQGAIAAGLLASGSQFLGTVEDAARLLQAIVRASSERGSIQECVSHEVAQIMASGRRVPGLGHNLHTDDDPRVAALVRVATEEGVAAKHVEALSHVQEFVRHRLDRKLPVNAAGMIGAVLSDVGYPPEEVRGFALVARSAGLFSHVVDEMKRPVGRRVWEAAHHGAFDAVNPRESGS